MNRSIVLAAGLGLLPMVPAAQTVEPLPQRMCYCARPSKDLYHPVEVVKANPAPGCADVSYHADGKAPWENLLTCKDFEYCLQSGARSADLEESCYRRPIGRPAKIAALPSDYSVTIAVGACQTSSPEAGIAETTRLLDDWTPDAGQRQRAMVLRCRGSFHAQARDWDKALADLDFAVSLDTREALSFFARASVYAMKGDKALALRDYDSGLRLDPGNAGALLQRGILNDQLENLDQAIADCSKALALKAEGCRACALVTLADAYRKKGEPGKAVDCYDQLLVMTPGQAQFILSRALSLVSLRKYSKARTEFDRYLSLNPHDACGLTMRGLLALRRGRPSEARQDVDKALSIAPAEPCAVDVRGMMSFEAGAIDSALADFKKASELSPDEPGLRLDVAVALYRLGKRQEAVQLWRGAAAARPFFTEGLDALDRHGYFYTPAAGSWYEKMRKDFSLEKLSAPSDTPSAPL